VDGLREKLREFFREEVRAEVRAMAALSNVELITALLSSNRQMALVGLQLRIINGAVSLLTTEIRNKAMAAYLSEPKGVNGNSGLTTSVTTPRGCYTTAGESAHIPGQAGGSRSSQSGGPFDRHASGQSEGEEGQPFAGLLL
jgi:hypothetical protein